MKQIVQSLRTGHTALEDFPAPMGGGIGISVHSRLSLVSSGTERMLLEFGKAGWLEKVRQQPDQVRMVLDKVGTDGLLPTIASVRAKLDQPIVLGYCNVGVVRGGGGWEPGTRVASNGVHAELVRVARNLTAKIPDSVSDATASFTVLGAIALQGIRLLNPSLGETMVVMGLGLIGQLAVQILKASGCRVIGLDLDPKRVAMAKQWGAEDWDGSTEVDGVLIAAATSSSEPVSQAAKMCRKRGRIVLVGVTGLELSRDDFYKKELSFQVSCSYGPGRYDPVYEDRGIDYPKPYVRWTAQRNFEAVLQLMAEGKLVTEPLITHRFPFDRALEAYEMITSGTSHLGVLLEYPDAPKMDATITVTPRQGTGKPTGAVVSFVGAGQYATRVLMPAVKLAKGHLKTVCASGGTSAALAARQFGFEQASCDRAAVWGDAETNAVFIATRHDSHARLALEALAAGKHVFVEKPLALTEEDLDALARKLDEQPSLQLMVGFNRRFAPLVVEMQKHLTKADGKKAIVITVNAGAIPREHWSQDPELGGGRIAGEACHFLDLARFLAGSEIRGVQAVKAEEDTASLQVQFADGSFATILYLANGSKKFPKERVEVFWAGRILQLDNFRVLRGFGVPGLTKKSLWKQDKGQAECVRQFLEAVEKGKVAPIPVDEILEVSRWILKAARG
jgi:predicted dehydrogenase/threonine dehydrogenase-like Zn-dependent dehydrogenase